jgi:transposase
MYFVGIDCSKYKHDCFIATEAGEVIRDTFTFDNSGTGFSQFFSILEALSCPKSQIKVGFESTSHYMVPLMKHLSVKGYEFILLNPVIVSRFRRSTTLRRIKTDKIDAKTIAQVLASSDYESYHMQVYHFPELKSLTRLRDRLVKQRSYYLVMLTNVLDEVFPEFKEFFNDSLKSKTAFYLLDTYKIPTRMANMNASSFDNLKKVSYGKFSYAKFIKLKELAKNTIGSSSDADELEISSLLSIYKSINDEICRVESKIEEIMNIIDSPTVSIPGVGLMSAASIIAEFGDLSRFANADKMLAYAGLDCGRSQSGIADYKGKMVKHGSGYLRQALMNVVETMMIHAPVFYDFYHKKRDEGKSHRVALSHLARKLVRLIYKLETSHSRFDLNNSK